VLTCLDGMRALTSSLVVAVGLAASAVSCAASRGGDIEPRYVAVHNTLSAMGLVQTAPIQEGSLAEGREARVRLELPAQCTTVVAIGGAGVRDLDVTLLDADDRPIVRDTAKSALAALRACVETPGRFTLLVRMAAGAGDYVTAAWSGSTGSTASAQASSALSSVGTCESPLPLASGVTQGNTRRGDAEHAGSCASSDAKELVYRLELPRRQRVSIEIAAQFDSVLHVRKDECGEEGAEVACNDDGGGSKRGGARGSRIDETLDAGVYYVFVDGYGAEAGTFKMTVELSDVPSLSDACSRARPLALAKTAGTLEAAFDHARASCGDEAGGPDAIFRLDVAQRARLRIVERSEDFSPVVHLRRLCADETTELGCSDSGMTTEEATFVRVLDPGSYAVFADTSEKAARGAYSIGAELVPDTGSGARGDACADAIALTSSERSVTGDTFAARDDVAGRCSGQGAPDLVYKLEIPKRSRVTARFAKEEGEHVFVVLRSCVDRSTEIACTETLDDVFAPGVYYLAVDGKTRDSFGRFSFSLQVRDVSAREVACRSATTLVDGHTVHGSTSSTEDKFAVSCAGREEAQASGDRVYKLVLPSKARIRLLLSTPGWDGVLAVRKACLDPANARSLRAGEVACNNDADDTQHSRIETTLDAGTYFVLVDGHQGKNEGAYTLEYRVLR
jgi:hypothetical protein